MKPYQKTIELATVYKTARSANNGGTEQIQPNIEVVGGTVDIYGSQTEPVSAPTGMYKTRDGFVGIDTFDVIPSYIYIAQNTGTTTSIILSGVEAVEVD